MDYNQSLMKLVRFIYNWEDLIAVLGHDQMVYTL